LKKIYTVMAAVALLALLCGGLATQAQASPGTDVIIGKVYFYTSGLGSFTAGPYNTASGNKIGWFVVGKSIPLKATPAPGWEFSHWTFNGGYGSSNPSTSVPARIGLQIKAHFTQK